MCARMSNRVSVWKSFADPNLTRETIVKRLQIGLCTAQVEVLLGLPDIANQRNCILAAERP